MINMSNLYSVDLERHLLGGLINNPNSIAQVDGFLTESDFKSSEHSVIYSSIKQILEEKRDLNLPILIHRVESLGIKFKGEMDIGEYIDSISFKKMSEKGVVDTAKVIVKLRVLRDIKGAASDVNKYLEQHKEEPIDKIIGDIDGIYSGTINNFCIEDGPTNLLEGLADAVRERGNDPQEAVGLKTPFEHFNRLYGELRGGNIYAIASRPGQGKTTFLNQMGYGVSELNNVPVLFLDTEMSTEEIKFRTAAAVTGVPLWYLETGNWNKNASMRNKVNEALSKMNKLPIYHEHVGNKTVDEVASIIRRWYWQVVGRGNKCLICYDYLKLTGEKLSNNWAEYQAIGEKTDKLKRISEEIDCPIFTAIQINRSGENFGRDSARVTDDSSVISQSDRLMWFCTFLAIFRQKTRDEILEDRSNDGEDKFGTHKMVRLKGRYQGKDASGHNDFVQRKMKDGSEEFQPNYINFDVKNFKVKEAGTLDDIVKDQELGDEILEAGDNKNEESVFE
jgi:replicative DNA helicase